MNINRNNYEEYFLLYADKELSAEERNGVKLFVKQNPDLEEEFIMLQQSVVKPDTTIAFEDKNTLFRKQEFIRLDNYEEKFLLFTDNELNSQEIEKTEKFVLANPLLQHEFTLFQKVTYEPDTSIVFPGKSLLYKKEEDTRVIPFGWKSMAAAVLIGIALWTGISYLQKNDVKHEVAIKPVAPPANVKDKNEQVKKPLVYTEKTEKAPLQKAPVNQPANLIQQPQEEVTVKNIPPADKKPAIKSVEQKKEDVAVAVNEIPVKTVIEKPVNGLPQPLNWVDEPNDKTVTSTPVLQNDNHAVPASYITDADEKSENYVFYNITAEEFRKSKIGNFLKKAKRAIAGKLPLKNGLKFGKVEIARDDQN